MREGWRATLAEGLLRERLHGRLLVLLLQQLLLLQVALQLEHALHHLLETASLSSAQYIHATADATAVGTARRGEHEPAQLAAWLAVESGDGVGELAASLSPWLAPHARRTATTPTLVPLHHRP